VSFVSVEDLVEDGRKNCGDLLADLNLSRSQVWDRILKKVVNDALVDLHSVVLVLPSILADGGVVLYWPACPED
jgi:hypothetical protein